MELSEREIENYIWDDLIDNDGIKLQEKGGRFTSKTGSRQKTRVYVPESQQLQSRYYHRTKFDQVKKELV